MTILIQLGVGIALAILTYKVNERRGCMTFFSTIAIASILAGLAWLSSPAWGLTFGLGILVGLALSCF